MTLSLQAILLLFIFLNPFVKSLRANAVSTSDPAAISTQNAHFTTEDDFEFLTKKIKHLMKDFMKISPIDGRILLNVNITGRCRNSLISLVAGIRQLKPFAVAMLDATGKLKSGLVRVTSNFPGSYDQCLDITAFEDKARNKPAFHGKYCSIQVVPPLPSKKFADSYMDALFPQLKKQTDFYEAMQSAVKDKNFWSKYAAVSGGVCVPSTCSKDDIALLAATVGREFKLKTIVSYCDVKGEGVKFTPIQLAVIGSFLFLVVVVICATCFDVFLKKDSTSKSFCLRVLLSFSAFTNSKKMFDVKETSELSCLHGMRVVSIIWVILGHTYVAHFGFSDEVINFFYLKENLLGSLVTFTTISMHTFIFIGGLLVSYVIIKARNEKNSSFDINKYVLHRFMRISPGFYAIVAFTLLLPNLISGPMVHVFKTFFSENQKYLWRNVLYISNFFPVTENAVAHGWYLCVDFQLYLFSIIILLPLIKWPKVGLTLNFVLIVCCGVVVGCIVYKKEIIPILATIQTAESGYQYLNNIYLKPYSYVGSYGMGMFSGYILATRRNITLSVFVRAFGWIICCGSSLLTLFGLYRWDYQDPNAVIKSTLYSSFQGISWTLGVFWIVLMCCNGYGGWVNSILSWKALVPLSRMTFSVYLVHPYVMALYIGNSRHTFSSAAISMLWLFFGHVLVSYVVGYFFSLLVECPFISMEKIIFLQSSKASKKGALKEEPIETISVKILQHSSAYNKAYVNSI